MSGKMSDCIYLVKVSRERHGFSSTEKVLQKLLQNITRDLHNEVFHKKNGNIQDLPSTGPCMIQKICRNRDHIRLELLAS